MKVFIVYKTDSWHSFASRDLIGIATSKDEYINICQAQAKKENKIITTDDIFNLSNIMQTQGCLLEGELYVEEVSTNMLL